MVHWGPITSEQKDIYRHRLDHVPDVAKTFIGDVINGNGFMKTEPKEVNIKEIDEKFRGIVVENMLLYEKLREHKLKPM